MSRFTGICNVWREFFYAPAWWNYVGAWADRFGRKPAMVFTIAL